VEDAGQVIPGNSLKLQRLHLEVSKGLGCALGVKGRNCIKLERRRNPGLK
jgi:hypothetical protein